jgi:methionyl-tRNA formyltransferase
LDTGPVLLREATDILPTDTTLILHDRLSDMGAALIVKALDSYLELEAKVQSVDGVTYAAKIDKAEAKIDWSKSAVEVDRLIRGLSPFPGAWFQLDGQRVKVLNSQVVDMNGQVGEVLDDALTVACGSGSVRLLRLQRAGKGAMDAASFLRGIKITKNTRLVN